MNRGACELCNCRKFKVYSGDINYKCRCSHGDVWHKRETVKPKSEPVININPKNQTRDKLKKLIKPLIQIFNRKSDINLSRECPICLDNIETLVVLNCGHSFCLKCSRNLAVTCPMCRVYITNKIKVF